MNDAHIQRAAGPEPAEGLGSNCAMQCPPDVEPPYADLEPATVSLCELIVVLTGVVLPVAVAIGLIWHG
jgi:hypothetical protein